MIYMNGRLVSMVKVFMHEDERRIQFFCDKGIEIIDILSLVVNKTKGYIILKKKYPSKESESRESKLKMKPVILTLKL